MKTICKLLLIAALGVYLFFAFTRFYYSGSRATCTQVNVVITDSAHAGFITAAEAKSILERAKKSPVGTRMDRINTKELELILEKNPFIREAVCYKTPDHRINLLISQRLPLLRVMTDNDEDYYIDDYGYNMAPMGYVADLAVATGHIDRKFAKNQLVRLGKFLRNNDFWNDQIEQINITADQQVELIPRVGGQTIFLGSCDSLSLKFRNLRALYDNVMAEVGWNKYERINLEHINQVICTKRHKENGLVL